MKRIYSLMILLISVFLWNCGPVYPDPDDGNLYPQPQISDIILNYNSEQELVHIECRVNYDSIPNRVQAHIYRNGSETAERLYSLNDLGLYGDLFSGDGIYGVSENLAHADSLADTFYVEFTVAADGQPDVSAGDSLILAPNRNPFITEIVMPDTVIRPVSGVKEIYIYVLADDPDGIQDVEDGFFQVKSNTTGAWGVDYYLYDDATNGDSLAGDGIFSRGLTISSENSATSNYFRFRLRDSALNFSEWVPDSIVVR